MVKEAQPDLCKCVKLLVCCVPAILQTLAHSFGWMLSSVGGARKVFEYLDRKPQVSTDGKLRPDVMNGRVTFHHVRFAYPTSPENQVLQVRRNLQLDDGGVLIWERPLVMYLLASGLFFGAQVGSGDGAGGGIGRR